ncbi:MAG TPA: RdgB/HAM1 family non-canonical purine NTP pyrophosphatase [Polyangia bacterium]|jgi:XTP/dITP diphosphohydrolase|nr:RdgB/HAM1 family non-canonical purine NTP pyrophosphatase [Polyangia bacterium]
MRVVLATRNQGKVRELAPLFDELGLGFEIVAIDDVAPRAELREDGHTFEENALAKARQAAAATGLPALADDSGLEVDALGGAPGVYSARYAGVGATDAANNAKLEAALRGIPADRRTARYRCVAAFVDPTRGLEITRAGACEGTLLEAPRGAGGFGYDPYFLVPARALTMAEIPLDEKNQLSHRSAAFRALAVALAELRGR